MNVKRWTSQFSIRMIRITDTSWLALSHIPSICVPTHWSFLGSVCSHHRYHVNGPISLRLVTLSPCPGLCNPQPEAAPSAYVAEKSTAAHKCCEWSGDCWAFNRELATASILKKLPWFTTIEDSRLTITNSISLPQLISLTSSCYSSLAMLFQ